MTREILLPATPSLMCWVAIDRAMRLAISVKSAKAAPRSVSSGDARGKAEANLALCGEVDAVLTPAHLGRLRSSQGRAAKNHPIFRNSRRAPAEALVPTTLASTRAVIEYLVEFDGHINYLPTLLKSSILRSPACCRGRAR
jgi:hypothetical protein